MRISRRSFLGAATVTAAGAALAPRLKWARAGAPKFRSRRVVVVGIGGGLRKSEALGMSVGATMPNLFGRVPLTAGSGDGDAGDPVIAPEYAAQARALVLPAPRKTPLYTEGALVANLRYDGGAPGHLQGQACLVSGFYNNIENRADARLPVPTIFEIHRRESNAPATDAWYISNPGGFYSALQTSANPEFGPRFGGSFLSPPGAVSALLPLVTSGKRSLDLDLAGGAAPALPVIPGSPEESAAVRRMSAILDGNSPAPSNDGRFRASDADNAAIEDHLADIYGDPTYQAIFPESFGIGLDDGSGGIDQTSDALTVYHAERILAKFAPTVLAMTLLDIDTCHNDFNGYVRNQQVADACVSHLWSFIQSTDGLRDQTTLLVLPEHGRHLYTNGQNPDSLGRSGIDHGEGDDGDREVFMLALGPDIAPVGVIEPTGVEQSGRTSGRYETIDVVMSAMSLLGYDQVMKSSLEEEEARPGLFIEEMLR
ncbi:MAG TPA: twin-arginine translocation signal domain-containing protein [Kofleriaceae bacterium]|nr:twin-arginine translocation signal domain-containing protein [Kofleriaceae bacterium]